MIQAMISGHPGSMTTVHANDPLSAMFRLELLCRMSEVPLPADVARSQVALAVRVVAQVDRDIQGVRRVLQVCEVVGTDPNTVTRFAASTASVRTPTACSC